MSAPDFEHMTKDEVIAWFDRSGDVSPLLSGMAPAAEPVRQRGSEPPMMLLSIRLPVDLVEKLDSLADLEGIRRSELIREALTGYVDEHTSPVGRDEAERALDVLRRIVIGRTGGRPEAT